LVLVPVKTYSTNGTTWIRVNGNPIISMPSAVVGLAVNSKDSTVLSVATFSNFSVLGILQ